MQLQQAVLGALASPAVNPGHHFNAKMSNISVPQYVLDYAPLVYLHENETYLPADWASQLLHTVPGVNYTRVTSSPSPLTLDNLSALNSPNGTSVYLTATDDVSQDPSWLSGVKPDATGLTPNTVSSVIITHDRGNNTLDAFYVYFYAFNLGDVVLDTYLGNHVGDIEHNMIRFVNATPTSIWYSQHTFGSAFTYAAAPKSSENPKRPVTYSANGTHANWATIGSHEHLIPDLDLPDGPALDYTSAGTLWDPTLSAYYYAVSFPPDADANATNAAFTAYSQPNGTSSFSSAYCVSFNNATSAGSEGGSCAGSAHIPVDFLYFLGQWGDKQYPKSDPRQVDFLDLGVEFKWTDGPNGVLFKGLNRKEVCPNNGDLCIVRDVIEPGD